MARPRSTNRIAQTTLWVDGYASITQVSPPFKPTRRWAYLVGNSGSHTPVPSGSVRPITREVRVSGYNNNYSDEFDLDGQDQRGGGGLRKILEETLAENKKLLARLEGQDREKSTAALLKEKGLDPAIADLIPPEMNADEWVTKYAHLLGVPHGTEDHTPIVPDLQVADDSDPAVVAQRERLAAERQALADMQAAQEDGSSAVQRSLLDGMNAIQSEEELLKFFKENAPLEQD